MTTRYIRASGLHPTGCRSWPATHSTNKQLPTLAAQHVGAMSGIGKAAALSRVRRCVWRGLPLQAGTP